MRGTTSYTGAANWRKWALQTWAPRTSPSGEGALGGRRDRGSEKGLPSQVPRVAGVEFWKSNYEID